MNFRIYFPITIKKISYLCVLGFIAFCTGCAVTPHPRTVGPSTIMPGGMPFSHPQTVTHIVGPSETLWRISRIYDVDMNTLLQANKLSDPAKVAKGQKLIIPDTYGPQPVIPLYPSKKWTHIVIHHTATDVGNSFSIDQLHHKRKFWNGLGYHFLIDNGTAMTQDGQIEVGPRWIKQMDGAHANANGMNERGIGISLVGNYSKTHVTRQQLGSLIFLVKILQGYYHIPGKNVLRHRDVPGKHTECPGNYFPWQEFKSRL